MKVPAGPLKLAMLPTVQRLVDVRRELLAQLHAVRQVGVSTLTVNIHGPGTLRRTWSQDDTILEMVRPTIARELAARISSIDTDLRTMGVEVS